MKKKEKYIDIVFVRHGDTSGEDQELLESGDAPLSSEGHEQGENAGKKLDGMDFDLMARGGLTRMRQTTDHISKHVTYNQWICDTRLDPRTNSKSGKLYPENAGDRLIDEYHQIAIRFIQNMAERFSKGGRVLAIGSGAYIVPMYVMANGIIPLSEEQYLNTLYARFAPKPGSIHCFRYFLETGEMRTISLEEVKKSS